MNSEEQKQRSIEDGTDKQAEWRILGTTEAMMMTQWKKRLGKADIDQDGTNRCQLQGKEEVHSNNAQDQCRIKTEIT